MMIPDFTTSVRAASVRTVRPHPARALTHIAAATSLVVTLATASCGTHPAALHGTTGPANQLGATAEPDIPQRATAMTESATRWVDQTLARLTLRQKAAQLLVPWISGAYLASDSDAYDRLRELIVTHGIGGVVISIGPPLEVAARINALQELADVPILVTADMEHGPGQRLDGGVVLPWGLRNGGGTRFPPVMALGAADDERLAYELGRITALEARAVGIGMVLAPVVDVNNNPANPVINTRSYGADPHRVARLAAAHVRGLQEHGVYAVAKHFPGHGDTGIDSHIDLPTIPVDRARADSVELVPFRAAIDAGVAGVMSAHITFPALAGDTVPATLSPRILTGLLKDELGFDGLVVSDALDMGAIVRRYGPDEAPVRALEAGADLLLMPADLSRALDAIVAAVESGRLTESRIDRSVRKLLHLKAGLGLHERRTVSLDDVPRRVGGRAHTAVADEVATRAITLVRDRDHLVPVSGQRTRAVGIAYTADPDPLAGRAFHQTLAPAFRSFATYYIDPATPATRLDSIRAEAGKADVVFVSTFVRVITGKGSIAIPAEVAEFIAALDRDRPTIVTSFGNPYLIQQFPEVGSYLLAWGPEEVAQRAAARAILGRAPITGTLPIEIPPYHPIGAGIVRGTRETATSTHETTSPSTGVPAPAGPAPATTSPGETSARHHRDLPRAHPREVGMDPTALAKVDQLIEDAIRTGAIPGAALAIGRHGKLVRLRGYGRLDPRPGFAPATDSSIYDLASLTKVVGTTTAAMILAEEGRLDLDAPVARYLPEWNGSDPKRRVTVRQLLLHTSGLPAYAPLWREYAGREAFLHQIAHLELQYRPGSKVVYSDFGMILVGLIIERITGKTLDEFLEDKVFQPLGMIDTGFNPRTWRIGSVSDRTPLKAAPAAVDDVAPTPLPARADPPGEPELLARIAPTELDRVYRMTHVHAVVHDENAYALGGVAGHAGLFSSARDLARFAQLLLDGGTYRRAGDPDDAPARRLLRAETIRAFTTPVAPYGRALGWDTPANNSSAGKHFSASSFGHTGFTGTSIWIDPERDLFVILLTNRVNPTRANQRHAPLRRAIHDAVQEAIVDVTRPRRADPGTGATR